MKKETLHKYICLAQKSVLEIWIPVTSIDREVLSFKLWQIQLLRSYRGVVEETEAFLIDPPAIERCRAICPQVSSFPSAGVELSIQL